MRIIPCILYCLLLVFLSACSAEDLPGIPEQPQFKFPEVVNVKPLIYNVLDNINLYSSPNARFGDDYDIHSAEVAKYEGYDNLEFIYLPHNDNQQRSTVIVYKDQQIVKDFSYDLVVTADSIMVDFGNDRLIFMLVNDIVTRYKSESINLPNGRAPKDIFNSYLQCEDAISTQASDRICKGCGAGKMGFQLACAAFRPCAGAVIVGCTAYILSYWWNGKDGWGADERSKG